MMCPVCKRDLAPTLSICLTCGAMMNDTVREELQTKISGNAEPVTSTSGKLDRPKTPAPPAVQKKPLIDPPAQRAAAPKIATAPPPTTHAPTPPPPTTHAPATPPTTIAPPKPIGTRFETADLRVKKTSQTLVEFQTKKATVPEWRLQLQNSVRQKVGTNRRADSTSEAASAPSKPKTTSGANALKVEYVEDEQPARHQNPRVASALKRIEESRRVFTNQPVAEQSVQVGKATPRNYPFNVVARSNEAPVTKVPQKATVNPSPKPMLVSPLKIEKRGFDTNKLPPLERSPDKISTRLEVPATKTSSSPEVKDREQKRISLDENLIESQLVEIVDEETDEIEDLAPLSMRFNAGLFDMIIGVFATLILLSPFILSGGSWISFPGFLAMTAAVAIVMFLYLTISIAFIGRTFGMRLFSLELVDVEENAYPTLHQAAVNSSVYLLSLALAGVGFLPVFFNEERRAAHDILSGTILIREY